MWGNGCLRAFQALRCGFESRHSLQSLCSVNAACRALNPGGGGSSPPRGTSGHVAQSGRGNRLRACPVAVRVRPWSPSARGATGRRGTSRPCRSGFESPRADHSQRGGVGLRSRPKPDRPALGRACGFGSHRWDHPEGDIVEGKDAALSAREYGFEPVVLARMGSSFYERKSCGGKGRRPWRSHKPRNAGSIPASATMAGSFKGRTAVLQAAHGGSIPSPATILPATRREGRPSRVAVV